LEDRDREDDVEALRGEVAALRAENALLRAAFEALPVGAVAVNAEGKAFVFNAAVRAITGGGYRGTSTSEERVKAYNLFESDGRTRVRPEDEPTGRAMRGERIDGWEGVLRPAGTPAEAEGEGIRFVIDGRPLQDAEGRPLGALITARDVTAQRRMERELEARRAALEESEAAREDLVARLRAAIDELETPVLQVGRDTLVVPVIGVVDSQRSARMTTRLLDEVSRLGAAYVIVDWTGVDIVDTATAASFLDMARAVGLLGARCVLTGLRSAVAQTLVDLGVSFGGIPTLRNLAQGLDYCARVPR
jgi:rsbT co-antagonist protein RsbR